MSLHCAAARVCRFLLGFPLACAGGAMQNFLQKFPRKFWTRILVIMGPGLFGASLYRETLAVFGPSFDGETLGVFLPVWAKFYRPIWVLAQFWATPFSLRGEFVP